MTQWQNSNSKRLFAKTYFRKPYAAVHCVFHSVLILVDMQGRLYFQTYCLRKDSGWQEFNKPHLLFKKMTIQRVGSADKSEEERIDKNQYRYTWNTGHFEGNKDVSNFPQQLAYYCKSPEMVICSRKKN